MVGDSAVDLATARNAGTEICLARYGFGYRFAPEDFRGNELFIDSPGDLVELLRGHSDPRLPSCHVRTTFTVPPHPTKITQEKERKGVFFFKEVTPFLPSPV
jgi:hypothetical protein